MRPVTTSPASRRVAEPGHTEESGRPPAGPGQKRRRPGGEAMTPATRRRLADACGYAAMTVVLVINTYAARWLGFNTADEITIVFCGSKKSLANGIPMANVLFPAAAVGAMVLPLMIFHQVQLMVCAVLAQRYARKTAKQRAEAEALAAK